MSSAGPSSAPLRPSVFLSYSSDDRAAARALRDALAAGGLEVWYDENELGGGDAWDQKIRRQIRDCDYFMPVISASTERRKEGYFRREWRLASERTMDMADDVLFLLPVVIDGTSESGARVPDKFVSVQWLRAPAGQPTPALEALIKRLLAGEHTAPARPPLIGRTAAPFPAPAPAATPPVAPPPPPPSGPPPMPAFPHHPPHSGHWARYIAEVLWWIITAGWLLFSRLPRWLRIVVTIWAVITLFGMCKSTTTTPKRTPKGDAPVADSAVNDELKNAIKSVGEETAAAIKNATKDGKEPDLGKIGVEMARRFGSKASTAGKALVVVPFASETADAADQEFARAVFSACYGNLMLARPTATGLSTTTALGTEEALTRVGRETGAHFTLGGRVAVTANGSHALVVRLIRIEDGSVAWSGDYPVAAGDATKVGSTIAEAVIAALPPPTQKK